MALIRCEQCGKEISDTMNACPFCGNVRQKEEAIASFRVADLKTEGNKPLMKEIFVTVCGVMAACVFLRLLLPVLYGNIFGPILGNGFLHVYGGDLRRAKFYLVPIFLCFDRLRLDDFVVFSAEQTLSKNGRPWNWNCRYSCLYRCELCHSSRNA